MFCGFRCPTHPAGTVLSGFIQAVAHVRTSFSFPLNAVPLYECATFPASIHLLMDVRVVSASA